MKWSRFYFFLLQVFHSLSLTTWCLLIGSLLFVWFWIFGNRGLYDLESLRHQRAAFTAKKTELLEEEKTLQKRLNDLQDPQVLKQLIRKELGYIEADEVVIQFPKSE